MLFSLLLTGFAAAQDCDVRALSKDVLAAGPHEAAPMFVQLAACDSSAAAKVAGRVIPTLIGESDGFAAANAAIEAGAGASVMTWIGALQQDERSRAIRSFGKSCQDSERVQGFLVDAHASLGDDFWTGRWYRALTECRSDAITGLLTEKVDGGAGDDRGAFFGVVEAYATNVGPTAVPKLAELAGAEEDQEMQANLIGAFADAAQAGTLAGLNVETASLAAAAIRDLAPNLPAKSVEQARITLAVLQDEQGADAIVVHRYRDLLQEDGTLLYGAVVVENAVCKNGKAQQRYHVASASDPGQTWPDQLEDKVGSAIEVGWTLNLAERCKGTGETTVYTPDAPFADKAAMKLWVKQVVRKIANAEVKKAVRVDQEPIAL